MPPMKINYYKCILAVPNVNNQRLCFLIKADKRDIWYTLCIHNHEDANDNRTYVLSDYSLYRVPVKIFDTHTRWK